MCMVAGLGSMWAAESLTCWAGLSLYVNKMGPLIINVNFLSKLAAIFFTDVFVP
jgi:hypothetical protein